MSMKKIFIFFRKTVDNAQVIRYNYKYRVREATTKCPERKLKKVENNC
jgi:hypothetical protein